MLTKPDLIIIMFNLNSILIHLQYSIETFNLNSILIHSPSILMEMFNLNSILIHLQYSMEMKAEEPVAQ